MSSQDSPMTHGWVSRAHHPQFSVPRVPPPRSSRHSLALLQRAALTVTLSRPCCNVR